MWVCHHVCIYQLFFSEFVKVFLFVDLLSICFVCHIFKYHIGLSSFLLQAMQKSAKELSNAKSLCIKEGSLWIVGYKYFSHFVAKLFKNTPFLQITSLLFSEDKNVSWEIDRLKSKSSMKFLDSILPLIFWMNNFSWTQWSRTTLRWGCTCKEGYLGMLRAVNGHRL